MRLGPIRLVLGAFAALAIFNAVPRLLDLREENASPAASLHGKLAGHCLTYEAATLGDAIDDLNTLTGTHLVTMPDLRTRGFSGKLPTTDGGMDGARELASQAGLRLVSAGPHWALVSAVPPPQNDLPRHR